MGDEPINDQPDSGNFLERNHKKMLWIAFWANALSWTLLVVYVISGILSLIETIRVLQVYSQRISIQNSPQMPNYLIWGRGIVQILATFFTGVVYIMILKSVSLGLKILVDTNLNYKLGRGEENHA
jgi:hypothetical protein